MYQPTYTKIEQTPMVQAIRNFEDENYFKLNDLYLSIERGEIKFTHSKYIKLNDYLCATYGGWGSDNPNSFMMEHWLNDFRKLPGWLDV